MESSDISSSSNNQVSWNLSAAIIMEISFHLQEASKLFSTNRVPMAYKHLSAIELRIGCYFTKEEKDALRVISAKFESPRDVSKWKQGDHESYEVQQIENYREYNDLIMDALKKYGFLIKHAEDSKRMF